MRCIQTQPRQHVRLCIRTLNKKKYACSEGLGFTETLPDLWLLSLELWRESESLHTSWIIYLQCMGLNWKIWNKKESKTNKIGEKEMVHF